MNESFLIMRQKVRAFSILFENLFGMILHMKTMKVFNEGDQSI